MVIVKSKIKEIVSQSGEGINAVAGDFADVLNEKVNVLIKEACNRAKGNKRSTVMAKDL